MVRKREGSPQGLFGFAHKYFAAFAHRGCCYGEICSSHEGGKFFCLILSRLDSVVSTFTGNFGGIADEASHLR